MAQTRLKSGNLHMVGGDNGSDGNVLKSKGDGTMEWGVVIINPTFSSFDYPGDDTALDPAGSQSLVINGTGFKPSVTVTIDGTTPSSITRNSAEQLTVTTPAKSAGSQALVITNTDGGTASTNVSYNGIPAFTNAAGSLASAKSGESINVSAAATEPDGGAITYAVTSGALPSGISLNTSTGAITGTAPSVSADTTSNFTVTATDNENQSTARAYSITITPALPSNDFKVVTWTGNGTDGRAINVGFQPDMVWYKTRNQSNDHNLSDSTRGATKQVRPNRDIAEVSATDQIKSFTSTGFTVGTGGDANSSGNTYVAWCFKANGGTTSSNTDGTITSTVQANTAAGFSIIQYDGTGSAATIGHGLGVAPDIIFSKRTSSSADWVVGVSDWTKYLELNGNPGFRTASSVWNNTAPTSTVFSVASSGGSNGNGETNIAYAFKSIDGFSKIGTYTGNGSANGPIVETGFEPAFIMVKRYNTVSNWVIYDNNRNTTNPRYSYLLANENSASTGSAGDASPQLDFLSNGFRPSGTEGYVNASGDSYLYMAFANDPDTTAPTLADSFGAVAYTGDGNSSRVVTGLNFKPNLIWNKQYNGTTNHVLTDSVTGLHKYLTPSNSNAAASSTYYSSFNSNGWTMGNNHLNANSNESFINWAWKASGGVPTYNTTGSINSIVSANANAGFSISNFTGTGSAGTVAHGLSSTPEFVMIKNVSNVGSWLTWHKDYGGGDKYIYLDSTNAVATQSQFFNSTVPTSSVFSVGSHGDINGNGHNVTGYCFHSVSGYSKIDSYTGNGSASGNVVEPGFAPDFVIVKRTDGTSNWGMFDSERSDTYYQKGLMANLSDAEYAGTNVNSACEFLAAGHAAASSGGFRFRDGSSPYNVNSGTYIYLAFKIN